MLVSIKNRLPGLLDLSPLKDSSGRPLVLRGNASAEVLQEDVGHPVIQRVKASGWIEIVDTTTPAALPPPPTPPAPPVIKTSAPPEELVMPTMPEEQASTDASAPVAPAADAAEPPAPAAPAAESMKPSKRGNKPSSST